MMRPGFVSAIALGLSALSTPAAAQDFAVFIDLPKGATMDLVIEKTKGETRDGRTQPPVTATFRYRQTVTPQGDGYRVQQVMTGSVFPAGHESSGDESRMLAAATEVAYVTDEALAPMSVLDWPATVDRMLNLVGKAEPGGSQTANDQARKMVLDMGPELGAEFLLKEQNLLAMPQMLGIDLGDPVEQQQQVPNPLGGPPIDSTFRVELVSVDKPLARAVIRSTQTLDPKSARRSIEALMATLPVAKAGTPTNDIHIERTTVCVYDMDMRTGLTAKVACDMKAMFGGDGETIERTERTVVTQTLVSQP